MTRLSVIIPVYNVEAYLDECLQSLADQAYRDFEAVCVDDGSTDGSSAILAAWAEREPWVRVIAKPNGGVSSARNVGLEAAQGDYVCFLDSDDRFSPDALSVIARALDESEPDVLTYGGVAFPDGAADPWIASALRSRDTSWEGFDAAEVFAESERAVILIAVRRTLVAQGLRFDERMRLGEDLLFHFCAFARSLKSRVIPDEIYEYRVVRDGSATSAARTDVKAQRLEHVKVMSALFADYDACGVLDESLSQAVSWSGRYVLVDALKLPGADCAEVLEAYRQALLAVRSAEAWLSACTQEKEREAISEVLSGRRIGSLRRRALVTYLIRVYYGRQAAVRAIFGRP